MSTCLSRRDASGLALFALALSTAPLVQASDFSGTAALTSDYVWRGASQSDGDPAVQAGFKLAGASGIYVQVWGSSVEFAPETRASTEFDLVAGWSGALSDAWALESTDSRQRSEAPQPRKRTPRSKP